MAQESLFFILVQVTELIVLHLKGFFASGEFSIVLLDFGIGFKKLLLPLNEIEKIDIIM